MSNKKQTAPALTSEAVTPSIFGVTQEKAEHYKALLKEILIDPNKPEPEPEALLSLHGTPILWRGGKSFICAVAKARKTTTLTLFAAILCGRDETAAGFKALPGCKVLYIDTEQARTDSQRILFRTAQLTGVKAEALPLQVLALNKQDPETIRGLMETAVKEYRPDVLILDNWTDCVASIMDDKECTEFSRQLRMLAEAYNIAVFSVIHANESARNDDKPNFRGWGAEEARKSDLTLFLKDMGDYSKATFGRCRGKRPDGFCISIDTAGLPYLYTETPTPPNPDKYADIVKDISFIGINYTSLCDLIKKKKDCSLSTAKRDIKDMTDSGAIVAKGGLYYRPEDRPKEPESLPF